MHIFEDYKGFDSAKLDLFKPFTILIGPNGSGKSNLIEAIELFSYIAHGRPLYEISDIGRGGSLEIRGGLGNCPSFKKNIFSFSFDASIKFLGKNEPMKYVVSIEAKKAKIIFEGLTVGRHTIFCTKNCDKQQSDDITVEYNNFSRGGKNPNSSASTNRSIISQYNKFSLKNKEKNNCDRLINSIINYLKYSFIFDPVPSTMRTYERIGNSVLLKNGSNLSSVLYDLSIKGQESKDTLGRLLSWIKQLPDESYSEFDFVTTTLNDVIFGFRTQDNDFVDARLLSDGTLRCLAVLTALETADPGSRVIIEEFDNGLHPSRIRILTEAIQDCCERRKLNVLATTHNPATLNAITEEQLSGIVFCAFDKNKKVKTVFQFEDLPRHDEIIEHGRLGDLVTTRFIENYFDKNFGEKYKNESLEWIENFK